MLRKSISLILILTMIVSIFTIIPFSASAEETPDTTAELTNDDISVTGADSLGTMLADAYEENATDTENTGSGIYAVEVEGKTARVDMRVLTDAQLIVSIFDEDGKTMYGSGMTDVSPDDRIVELTLEIDTMPQYFLIRAFLLDKITNLPLCKQFENNYYTQEMQEFFAKTTDDFEEEKVLNLDGNKDENFLVYNDDTIIIENDDENTNVITKTDDDSKEYVIENIDEHIAALKAGDIFSYDSGDANLLIIKISSIVINGTTATIIGDEIKPEDVFDYIRIDAKQGAGDTSVDNSDLGDNIEYLGEDDDDNDLAPTGLELADIEATLGTSLSYKIFENKSSVKVNGNIGVKIEADIKFYYDAHLFEDDELEISVVLKYELSASLELELKNKQEIKIPIGRIEMMPCPGLIVRLTPALILEGKLSIKLQAKIKGQVGFGFEYGQAVDKTKAPTIETELKISGELFIGLSLAPEVAIIGDLASAELDARAGIKLTAEMEYPNDNQLSDEMHLCSSCVDGDIYFAIQLKFKFSLLHNENLTWNFDILDFEWKLGDFYYSLDSHTFAFTECPNKWYKQTITLLDKKYKPLVGAAVNGMDTDKKGVAELFLPNGKTALKIVKDGKEVIRWRFIDHVGKFTMVIDFDKPEGIGNGSSVLVSSNRKILMSGTCGENAYYSLYDDLSLYIYGSGDMDNYMYNNIHVKYSPWNKYRKQIKQVVIEDGIVTIGAYAFYQSVALEKVSMADSVTSIRECAFSSCSALKSLILSNNITSLSGIGGCSSLVNIVFPKKMKSISDFGGCTSLESITLPDSLLSIADYTFMGCTSLKRINIPKSVEKIGMDAFTNCNQLEAVCITDLEAWCNINFKHSSFSNPLRLAHNLYLNGSLVTDVVVPDSISDIGVAFQGSSIKSIILHNGIAAISESAFSNCTELENIIIPESVTSIGSGAFSGCSSLKKAILPNAVSSIEDYTFKNCTSLESINLDIISKKIGEDAFENCASLTNIVLNDSVSDIYDFAFNNCENIESLYLGKSAKYIGNRAFYNTKVKNVVLPDSVVVLGRNAFGECHELESIILSKSLKTLGRFDNCTSLKSIYIPATVEKLGGFSGCTNLNRITVAPSNKNYVDIEGVLFDKAVTELIHYPAKKDDVIYHIPSGVTTLDSYAFFEANNLKSLSIPEGVTYLWGSHTIYNCESLTVLFLPKSITGGSGESIHLYNLTDIYYAGSQEEWSQVRWDWYGNTLGMDTIIHYNYTYEEADLGFSDFEEAKITMDYYYVPTEDTIQLYRVSESNTALVGDDSDEDTNGLEYTASEFTCQHLVPATNAVLVIIEGTELSAKLNATSLLYISQETVDETGSISFDVQQDFSDKSWVAYIFGECDHSALTWTTSKEPASDEEGMKVLICDHCGDVLDSAAIDALPTEYLLGDADGNGEIESVDATFIQRYIAQIPTPYTKAELMRGDVDGSGDLELFDVTCIQRYLAKMETSYAIGKAI